MARGHSANSNQIRPKKFEAKRRRIVKMLDRDSFGGEGLRNGVDGSTHAKRKRPLQHGEWLHVCLKSGVAKGALSMRQPRVKKKIEQIVEKTSRHMGVRVSKWANVGNHLHFSIRVPSRRAYNRWIRSVSGLIARAVLQRERGRANVQSNEKFWASRPFSRIVRSFSAFDRLSLYVRKNQLEAMGYSTSHAKQIVRSIAAYEWFLDNTTPVDISKPPP